eukprot:EG_transcript_19324
MALVARVITSVRHPTVRHFVRLLQDPPYRQRQGSAVLDGRLVAELGRPGRVELKRLLYVPHDSPEPPGAMPTAHEVAAVSPEVMRHVVGRRGIHHVAEARVPPYPLEEPPLYAVALLGLRYPANVGNVLRSALGLGWDMAFVARPGPDPHGAVVVRASRGASLLLPLRVGDAAECAAFLRDMQRAGRRLVVADGGPEATPLPDFIRSGAPGADLSRRGALLIVAGESGLTGPWAAVLPPQCCRVAIPMVARPHFDSFNAAVAAGILLYALKPLPSPAA